MRASNNNFQALTLQEGFMPIQTEALYKQVKAIFLYQKEEKNNFPHSNAVLLISVGQPNHEGAKLAATIELVDRNFQSCDVVVCDVLQRHTMKINNFSTTEEIYNKSAIAGQEWIKRNKCSLELLKIPHRLFRWEEYLLRSNFPSCQEKILSLYEGDKIFKSAMNQTIEEFIVRYERHTIGIDRKKAFDCCLNYLAEESAVMMLMWPECDYHYIIYPGNVPKVLGAARHKFVEPYNPRLLKWLTVYARTRTSSKKSFNLNNGEQNNNE